jgi:hypothetical protein
MKRIYFYPYDGYLGEKDTFFDDNFKLIDYWDCNDASYRPEYMDSLFRQLGIEVAPLPKNKSKKACKSLENYMCRH